MPFPSANSFRYIRPVVFSSSVVASSTENTCTPDFVTISSGPTLAARALDPANAHIATTATAICNNRRPGERDNLTARSKFIAIAYPVAEDFCKEICAEPSILGSGGHILRQVRRICGDEHRAAALGGHDRKLPDRPVGRRSLARRRAVREHRFNQLVRQQSRRAVFRLDFRGHHALGTGPEPNEHVLTRPQFRHSESTQRFHMHEDVRRSLAAGEETETPKSVEPLDLRPLETTGRSNADMCTRRQHLRRVNGGGIIHRENAESLIALRPLHALAHQPGTFIRRLIAIAPKHRHVQKHVRPAVVRYNEAIAL